MKQIIKRRAASFLILALLTAMLPVPASAAGTVSYSDLKGVTWQYTISDSAVLNTIQDGNQTLEKASVLMISDRVKGHMVTGVESNGFDNVIVGHTDNQYILIAKGITNISEKAFYDFNYVSGVSIPSSVTSINYNAFDVLGREISVSFAKGEGTANGTGGADNGGGVSLNLDGTSSWIVIGTCPNRELSLGEATKLIACAAGIYDAGAECAGVPNGHWATMNRTC